MMFKSVTALAIGVLGIAPVAALAQNVNSMESVAKGRYEMARQDCAIIRPGEKAQCLKDAKGLYLSFSLRCDGKTGPAKAACLEQAEAAKDRASPGSTYASMESLDEHAAD